MDTDSFHNILLVFTAKLSEHCHEALVIGPDRQARIDKDLHFFQDLALHLSIGFGVNFRSFHMDMSKEITDVHEIYPSLQ